MPDDSKQFRKQGNRLTTYAKRLDITVGTRWACTAISGPRTRNIRAAQLDHLSRHQKAHPLRGRRLLPSHLTGYPTADPGQIAAAESQKSGRTWCSSLRSQ
jgi:hypothetical protein